MEDKDNPFPEVIKRVEILAGIVMLTGLVFKFVLQFPFAGPMLVVGTGTLAVAYAIGGTILLKSKTQETENKLLLNIAGKVLAVGLIGMLFKLMYWPNAMNILIVANIALPLVIGVVLWTKINANNSVQGTYSKLLVRSIILYTLVVFLYFIPNATLIAVQERGNDELIRLKTQSYDHPENAEYRQQLNDYYKHKNDNDTIR